MDFPELYAAGVVLELRAHTPPEPFGSPHYKSPRTPRVKDLTPEDIAHLKDEAELSFAHHPRERHEGSAELPGWFPKRNENHTMSLDIKCEMSLGDLGARVVLCSVESSAKKLWKSLNRKSPPKQVVAKIFDPIHYYNSPDMVAEADREYAQEAAAYIHLHNEQQKYAEKPGLVPKFYGTWTTNITRGHLRKRFDPSSTKNTSNEERSNFPIISGVNPDDDRLTPQSFRPVRIILMEFIDGLSLPEISNEAEVNGKVISNFPAEFASPKKRLQIFADILDSITRIEHLGITHNNLVPASFLVRDKDHRIVVIDFAQSDVAEYTDIGFTLLQTLPKPLNPLRHCEIGDYMDFVGWFPADWVADMSRFEAWARHTFAPEHYVGMEVVEEAARAYDWDEKLEKFAYLDGDEADRRQKEMMINWKPLPEEWTPIRPESREERAARNAEIELAKDRRQHENDHEL